MTISLKNMGSYHSGKQLARWLYDHITSGPIFLRSIKEPLFGTLVFANKTHCPSESYFWTDSLQHIGRNESTSFVTAQNGVLNESLLCQAFPQNPVLSAICYANVTRRAPCNVVENVRLHQYCFRISAFTESKASTGAAQTLLGIGGHEFSFPENVERERWNKMILNASFNTTASLFNANTHAIIEDANKSAIAMRLGQEVAAVAKALGVRLDDSIVESTFETVRKMPAFEPSTLQDRLAGHSLEIDNICGQVARLGQAAGVDVPLLLAVTQKLESINEAYVTDSFALPADLACLAGSAG